MSIEETKKYFDNFPEAPASDSFKWVDEQGFEHLSTIRAWHFKPLLDAFKDAQIEILAIGGKPISSQAKVSPMPTVQEKDEAGLPVVDGEGKPVMVQLPPNQKMHAVKGFYHGVSMANKDVLKVVYDGGSKYGIAIFDIPTALNGWKSWAAHQGKETPALFAPPPELRNIIIQEPAQGEKYPTIIEFRS